MPPIATLFMVEAAAGLMVTVPVPVGLIVTAALAGLMFVATSKETLLPPPAPHCNWDVPLALRKAPPALVAASK